MFMKTQVRESGYCDFHHSPNCGKIAYSLPDHRLERSSTFAACLRAIGEMQAALLEAGEWSPSAPKWWVEREFTAIAEKWAPRTCS